MDTEKLKKEVKMCECGCGTIIKKYCKKGNGIRRNEIKRYCVGHNRRGKGKEVEGKLNPFYGKHHTKENKKYWSEINKRSDIERYGEEKALIIREKIKRNRKNKSNSLKGKTYEEILGKEKALELIKLKRERKGDKSPTWGKKRTREDRHKQSESMKKKWKDPIYAGKVMGSKKVFSRPTNFEKRIANLCITYNLPFIYSGNGTFLIGNKNPDFICKEKKIAIEVFNYYHKRLSFGSVKNYIIERTKYFNKYGYKIIFIGEKEILDRDWENICLNKIMKGVNEIWQE